MLATRSLPILLALVTTAHAGASRAWTVAKSVIPPNLELVAGLDTGNLRASQLYQTLLPTLLAKIGGAQAKLDAIKSTCGIDLVASVDSIVVALQSTDKGTIVVAFKGTSRKDLEACGDKLAQASNKTLATTADGQLTRYSGVGDQDVYVRWLAADAFAISTQPSDKDLSTAGIKGGFASDKASLEGSDREPQHGRRRCGPSQSAPPTCRSERPANPKLALIYGNISITKGNLDVVAHAVFDDAAAATELATQANQALVEQQKTAMGSVAEILKSIVIKATGTQVVMTASPAERDVSGLVTMSLGLSH